MSKTSVHIPHKSLAPFIEAYVISYNGDSNAQNCFYPSDFPILCFDLNKKHFKESGSKNDFNFSFGLVGVVDHFMYLDKTPKKSLQVIFKPYGAFQFFKTPMHHFVNNGIDIESMLPNLKGWIHQLEDACHNDLDSIRILEQFLLEQLKSSPQEYSHFNRMQFAYKVLKTNRNTLNIKAICHKIGMSETRFRVHFKEKIGVSPKKISQIETFKQVQAYLEKSSTVDWMEVVEEFSFFDQTHFINNFKWFFGCTPTEYLKR